MCKQLLQYGGGRLSVPHVDMQPVSLSDIGIRRDSLLSFDSIFTIHTHVRHTFQTPQGTPP